MNRRTFLSSLLALIPIPFLRSIPWSERKKDPKDAFKEAVGSIVEAQAVAAQSDFEKRFARNCEYYHGHYWYSTTPEISLS